MALLNTMDGCSTFYPAMIKSGSIRVLQYPRQLAAGPHGRASRHSLLCIVLELMIVKQIQAPCWL